MIILAPVVVIALVGVGVLLFSGGDDDEPEFTGTVLNIDMGDYWFRGDLTGPAGPIRLAAVNVGNDRHNIGIRRVKISREVQPGESVVLDVGTLAAGEYELYCDLPGHVEAGMVAPLILT
jgi:Cupredoxin-like domain